MGAVKFMMSGEGVENSITAYINELPATVKG